jgi:hypothetical protein
MTVREFVAKKKEELDDFARHMETNYPELTELFERDWEDQCIAWAALRTEDDDEQ